MFLLGHIGIGSRLARPLVAREALPWLVVGCVLPDVLDKPLYYGLSLPTGKHAQELGLISSTRTFGHTLLFAMLCWLLMSRVSLRAAGLAGRGFALFAGLLTHLLLDVGGQVWGPIADRITGTPPLPIIGPTTLEGVLFPLFGPHFPIAPFHSFGEHAASLTNSYVVFGELLGGALLLLDWRAHRKQRARMVSADNAQR